MEYHFHLSLIDYAAFRHYFSPETLDVLESRLKRDDGTHLHVLSVPIGQDTIYVYSPWAKSHEELQSKSKF